MELTLKLCSLELHSFQLNCWFSGEATFFKMPRAQRVMCTVDCLSNEICSTLLNEFHLFSSYFFVLWEQMHRNAFCMAVVLATLLAADASNAIFSTSLLLLQRLHVVSLSDLSCVHRVTSRRARIDTKLRLVGSWPRALISHAKVKHAARCH